MKRLNPSKMKTGNQRFTLAGRRRYVATVVSVLFFSGLYINSAIAQEGRHITDRHTTVRNDGGRQNTRQQPSRARDSREQDVAVGTRRELNRNRNPQSIGGNNIPAGNNAANTERNIYRERNINRNLNGNRNIASRPGYNNRPVTGSLSRPGYRPVYGYDRRPVYNPHNPSWRYGYLPRRNSYFYSLPTTYLSFNFGGIGYRYWDGVFYRPYNNLFTVIAPPIGIYINVLPVGYRRIYVRNYPYYYYNGTYYDQKGSDYYVVSPPVGAVVESLPAGYATVVIDGETFYTADGAQYKPVIKENGEIWYEVIKANS